MSVLLKVLAGSSILAGASATAGVGYVLKHMDEMPEEIQEQYQMLVNKLNGRGWDKDKANMFILALAFFTWPVAVYQGVKERASK
jgi:hypothetical protein